MGRGPPYKRCSKWGTFAPIAKWRDDRTSWRCLEVREVSSSRTKVWSSRERTELWRQMWTTQSWSFSTEACPRCYRKMCGGHSGLITRPSVLTSFCTTKMKRQSASYRKQMIHDCGRKAYTTHDAKGYITTPKGISRRQRVSHDAKGYLATPKGMLTPF